MKEELKIKIMKMKFYLHFVVILVLFATGNAFAKNTNSLFCKENPAEAIMLQHIVDTNNDRELKITKKTEKGLDIYTFIPDSKIDKELLTAIENRLKVVVEGFVSLSVNDKNEVKIVTDPAVITNEKLDFCFVVVAKAYGYSDYTI